eukprot:14132972-Ditylum_brightwellii.AAC.1
MATWETTSVMSSGQQSSTQPQHVGTVQDPHSNLPPSHANPGGLRCCVFRMNCTWERIRRCCFVCRPSVLVFGGGVTESKCIRVAGT